MRQERSPCPCRGLSGDSASVRHDGAERQSRGVHGDHGAAASEVGGGPEALPWLATLLV